MFFSVSSRRWRDAKFISRWTSGVWRELGHFRRLTSALHIPPHDAFHDDMCWVLSCERWCVRVVILATPSKFLHVWCSS